MQYEPALIGLTDENEWLIDMVFTHKVSTIEYLVPKWQKINGAYTFVGWADKPQVIKSSSIVREFGTGNSGLRNLPLASNATVEHKDDIGVSIITFDMGASNLEAMDTGLTPATSARKYWPKLSNKVEYHLRHCSIEEVSSVIPFLTVDSQGILNNTWVNEIHYQDNNPNGQNALAMNPMNLSLWLDLYQGGGPGDSWLTGTSMSVTKVARYKPGEWENWGLLPEILYDANHGAILRMRLVNAAGIYDSMTVDGEPKTWSAACDLNLHTGQCTVE